MADLSTYTDTNGDTDVGPDRRATTGTSRWQTIVGIIGIVVVLWVGSRMFDIVFDDGPGGNRPAEGQEQEHTGPPPGGHGADADG